MEHAHFVEFRMEFVAVAYTTAYHHGKIEVEQEQVALVGYVNNGLNGGPFKPSAASEAFSFLPEAIQGLAIVVPLCGFPSPRPVLFARRGSDYVAQVRNVCYVHDKDVALVAPSGRYDTARPMQTFKIVSDVYMEQFGEALSASGGMGIYAGKQVRMSRAPEHARDIPEKEPRTWHVF